MLADRTRKCVINSDTRHKPARWTQIDRDYETLRIGMLTLFHDLGITAVSSAAA